MRPLAFRKRTPRNRDSRFYWLRLQLADTPTITWRLFRRAESGRWHMAAVVATRGEDRADVARRLAAARRELLDRVDTVDLQAMGLAS